MHEIRKIKYRSILARKISFTLITADQFLSTPDHENILLKQLLLLLFYCKYVLCISEGTIYRNKQEPMVNIRDQNANKAGREVLWTLRLNYYCLAINALWRNQTQRRGWQQELGQLKRDRSSWRFYHPTVKDVPVVQILPESRVVSIPSQLKGSCSCVFSFLSFSFLPTHLFFQT